MIEKVYSDDETQKAVLKELPNVFSRISSNLDIVEKSFLEGDYFNPNESAKMFGKDEMSIDEYFLSEMRNLDQGLSFVKNHPEYQNINENFLILEARLDRIFRPEKFIKNTLGYIMRLVNYIDKNRKNLDEENDVYFTMSSLNGSVLGLNSYFNKVRGIELDSYTLKYISDINKELLKMMLPLIEIK